MISLSLSQFKIFKFLQALSILIHLLFKVSAKLLFYLRQYLRSLQRRLLKKLNLFLVARTKIAFFYLM